MGEIQENEVVTLILGVGILMFFAVARTRLGEFPAWKTFLAGFIVLVCGWVLTVLETFGLNEELNILEHECYAGSSVLLALWCWRAFGGERRARE